VGPRTGLEGRKISSPPGFYQRIVQLVARSLYRLSYRAFSTVCEVKKTLYNHLPEDGPLCSKDVEDIEN